MEEQTNSSSSHFLGLTVSPRQMAFGLGLIALVPFALGVYYAYSHGAFNASRGLHWLLTYLGVIVGFIGGVQWGRMIGRGMAPPQDMVLAVIPPIVAWFGLLLTSQWWSFFMLIGALILAWLIDEHGYRSGWQDWWLLQLRRLLTVIVAGCVIAVAWRVLRGGV